MHFISSLNETRFTLNGIEYLKNYVSAVRAGNVEIFNCYETKDVLVPLSRPGEISVNGSVYEDALQLQAALQDVIYCRSTLTGGASSDQDNRGKKIALGTLANTDLDSVADKANLLQITIIDTDAPVLFSGIKPNGRSSVKYYYLFLGGKGTWGEGGSPILANHIVPLSTERVTVHLLYQEDNVLIHDLGAVHAQDFLKMVNGSTWHFKDPFTLYCFRYVDNDIACYNLFSNVPGVYGYEGTKMEAGDLVFVTDDTVEATSTTVTLQEAANAGNTIEDKDLILVREKSVLSLSARGIRNASGESATEIFFDPLKSSSVRFTIPAKERDDTFAMLSDLSGTPGRETLQSVLEKGSDAVIATAFSVNVSETSERAGRITVADGSIALSAAGRMSISSADACRIESREEIGIFSEAAITLGAAAGFRIDSGPGGTILSNPETGIRVNGNAHGVNLNGGDKGIFLEGQGGKIIMNANNNVEMNSPQLIKISGTVSLSSSSEAHPLIFGSDKATEPTIFRDSPKSIRIGHAGLNIGSSSFGNTTSVAEGLEVGNQITAGNGIFIRRLPATYESDFSSGFTDRSLVDKAYVDRKAGTIVSLTGDAVDNSDPLNPVVNVPSLDDILSRGQTTHNNIRIDNLQLYDSDEDDYKMIRISSGKYFLHSGYSGRYVENSFEFSGDLQNFIFPETGGKLVTQAWVQELLVSAAASSTVNGTLKLFSETGSNRDGTIDQNTLTTQLALKANIASPTFTGTVTLLNGSLIISGGASNNFIRGDGSSANFVTQVRIATLSSGTNSIAQIIPGVGMDNAIWQLQNQINVHSAFANKSADYTASEKDAIISCNGNITITLPLNAVAAGKRYLLKNAGTGTVSINVAGNGTIDGQPTKILSTQWSAAELVFDGNQYLITSLLS